MVDEQGDGDVPIGTVGTKVLVLASCDLKY
eukprot:COSAG01_NODE_52226_length_348_cov_0.759036_1_plen_29_part_10